MRRLSLSLVAIMIAMGPALAVSPQLDGFLGRLVGTSSVRFEPRLVEGKLGGCTLVFEGIQRDQVYRKGDFLRVSGSVAIMSLGGSFGSILKVVVEEIDATDTVPRFIPSAPSRAYLVGKSLNTNLGELVRAEPSDTPGGLFSIFKADETFTLVLEALNANEATIAFNQRGGATDMQFKVELDVTDVDATGNRSRSDAAKTEFTNCIKKLIE